MWSISLIPCDLIMMQIVQTEQSQHNTIIIIITIIICASASGVAVVPLVHIPVTVRVFYMFMSMLATSIFPVCVSRNVVQWVWIRINCCVLIYFLYVSSDQFIAWIGEHGV